MRVVVSSLHGFRPSSCKKQTLCLPTKWNFVVRSCAKRLPNPFAQDPANRPLQRLIGHCVAADPLEVHGEGCLVGGAVGYLVKLGYERDLVVGAGLRCDEVTPPVTPSACAVDHTADDAVLTVLQLEFDGDTFRLLFVLLLIIRGGRG